MSPRSGSSRTPPRGAKPPIAGLPPELETLLSELRNGSFDLLGRVRPVQALIERQITTFDRLQDGGLTVADIASLLLHLGVVAPDGRPVRESTLRSALSRARWAGHGPKATTRSTIRHRAASGRTEPHTATGRTDLPPSAADRVEPQPPAAVRADSPSPAMWRDGPPRSASTTVPVQHPAAASDPAQPVAATENEDRSPVQRRADLWNRASQS